MIEHEELGVTPVDWQIQPLSAVCSSHTGGTPPKSDPALWRGDVPWVSGKDLKSARLADVVDHITASAAAEYSRVAPAGSVLVLVRGMGLQNGFALSLIERPMAFNQDLRALIPRPGISGRFLAHALTFAGQRMLRNVSDAAHGTKRLSQDDLNDFRIPVPHLLEQQSIASVLDRARDAVDLARRCEADASALKRAAMRELFTHGLRGKPQKETALGLLPDAWDASVFAELRQWLQYGTSTRCGRTEARYPVLRIPNITPGRVDASDLKYCEMKETEAQRYQLENGDLLFIRTNGVVERLGACAVYAGEPAKALFASYLIRARVRTGRLDPRFAAFFFESERGTREVTSRATPAADGKYNLNTGAIDSFLVPLPPDLDEQREIVEILEAIDQKIGLHKRKKAVLEELFRALLHKLMTGEIRVADLDLSALDDVKQTEATA